MPKSNADEG